MGHSDKTVLDRVRFLPHPATPTFTDILGSAGGRSSGRLVGVLTPGTHFDTSLSAGMTQLRRHPTQVSVVVAHSGRLSLFSQQHRVRFVVAAGERGESVCREFVGGWLGLADSCSRFPVSCAPCRISAPCRFLPCPPGSPMEAPPARSGWPNQTVSSRGCLSPRQCRAFYRYVCASWHCAVRMPIVPLFIGG